MNSQTSIDRLDTLISGTSVVCGFMLSIIIAIHSFGGQFMSEHQRYVWWIVFLLALTCFAVGVMLCVAVAIIKTRQRLKELRMPANREGEHGE